MAGSNDLQLVIRAVDQASATLKKVQGEVETTAKRTSRIGGLFKDNYREAGAAAGGLLLALGATTAEGFRFNSAVEQSTAKINAFTKDAKRTGQILEFVKNEAAKTQFSFNDMADAAAGLVPASRSSGVALETLIRQAEVLAALNPAEGLTGAAFSLREALSGDFVSIVERFNLPRKRLNELREQGVPAIEAIRRSLAEMGVDFSVVAAQGETTSAKWAQLTDKFRMTLGALTAPIFEQVRKALSDLNPVFDQLQPKIIAFGEWIAQNQPALYALVGLIGGLLVGALVALVVVFAKIIIIVAIVAAVFAGIGALAGVIVQNWSGISAFFGGLWNSIAKFASDTWTAIVNGLNWLKNNWFEAIGFIIGFFATLPIKLPFLMWQAVMGIIGMVKNINWGEVFKALFNAWLAGWRSMFDMALGVFNWLKSLNWGAILVGIGKGLGNAVIGLIEGAINGALSGIPGVPKVRIPRFASGVENFAGGLAVVGERGPELVRLPRGADVYSNEESRRMAGVTINQTNHIHNQLDLDLANRELGYKLAMGIG